MKLQFLGSGDAFCREEDNFQSNALLYSNSGKRLLIDCGTDIRHAAERIHLTSSDFDAIYISHFHADHIGGLEWLAITRKFYSPKHKPQLMIHSSMRDLLWQSLSGGLQTIQEASCTLQTYFDLYPFTDETHFYWEDISFELVQTVHMQHNHHLTPSFGLWITYAGHKILFTTDTQFLPHRYMHYYQEATIIFHECETSDFKSGVHSHFTDLTTLPAEIKAKMWLYHYATPHCYDPHLHGFLGFVTRGQVFDFNEG